MKEHEVRKSVEPLASSTIEPETLTIEGIGPDGQPQTEELPIPAPGETTVGEKPFERIGTAPERPGGCRETVATLTWECHASEPQTLKRLRAAVREHLAHLSSWGIRTEWDGIGSGVELTTSDVLGLREQVQLEARLDLTRKLLADGTARSDEAYAALVQTEVILVDVLRRWERDARTEQLLEEVAEPVRFPGPAYGSGGCAVFELHRDEDETGTSGVGMVAQGVIFASGKCALSWLTEPTSVAVYDSIEQLEVIHGHSGKTRVAYVAAAEGAP